MLAPAHAGPRLSQAQHVAAERSTDTWLILPPTLLRLIPQAGHSRGPFLTRNWKVSQPAGWKTCATIAPLRPFRTRFGAIIWRLT